MIELLFYTVIPLLVILKNIFEDLENTIVDYIYSTPLFLSIIYILFLTYFIVFENSINIVVPVIMNIILHIEIITGFFIRTNTKQEDIYAFVFNLLNSIVFFIMTLLFIDNIIIKSLFLISSIIYFLYSFSFLDKMKILEKIILFFYNKLGTGINDILLVLFFIPYLLMIFLYNVKKASIVIMSSMLLSFLLVDIIYFFRLKKYYNKYQKTLFFVKIVFVLLSLIFSLTGSLLSIFVVLISLLIILFLEIKMKNTVEIEKPVEQLKNFDLFAYKIMVKDTNVYEENLFDIEKMKQKYKGEKVKLFFNLSMRPFFPIILTTFLVSFLTIFLY
jgi:hypothetical protein